MKRHLPVVPVVLALVFVVCAVGPTAARAAIERDGSEAHPLAVMLIPADGGTEDGTKKDFTPLFGAVTRSTGLHFDVRVGQSYGAVVEAMANGQVDVAFFGAVSYLQARKRASAELLAVAVEKGSSTYFSGIFVAKDSPLRSLADLKGKSLAVGDPSSTSSFAFPLFMVMDAGLDPVRDLAKIILAGSHVASLSACVEGRVDAAAASFLSFEKAVNEKKIAADALRPLARSEPIPNPPLAMAGRLPADMKAKLKAAFAHVHEAPGVTPDMIRGYGGVKVDRYDSGYSEGEFMKVAEKLGKVDAIRADILKKAGQ